ncbi:hypothetical protein AQUCO_03300023v1 [Aquilegia coerulea]|uniref:S-protein homolog n=1 Tax=Aquilegia coerulea TaxID=218851 RepID=A0A2G5CZ57_AQUCA|nr:hypothetical protein AQUCO_03300023v1 [Aquilegia coerulea]
MAIMNNITFIFIFIMVVSLWSCSSTFNRIVKMHVFIENELGPNNTLTVHCKSKDDDLGEHNVDFQDNYEWSFYENFFFTTLYWCRIWWYDHHQLVWVHNDMFDSNNDEEDLGCEYKGTMYSCVRRAQWDGIYFVQLNGEFKKIYNWSR